jgi:GT2 family glycosyltransferase
MPALDASVIILAYGDEPLLRACVSSVLESRLLDGRPLELEVLVVDNGSPAVATLPQDPRLRVLSMGKNTGFSGGCNAGARATAADVLVFVNSDALVEPAAISVLIEALRDEQASLVCGSVRLLEQPDVINSAGNPVHYLGVSWAGGHGEPAGKHQTSVPVTSLTGAFFATRRDTWELLGGFDETYFAYHEDVELSLRAWQRGLAVRYIPAAVALHDYDFARNATKHYLLERNRWLTILTVYPTPVLVAALPALMVFELGVCSLALVQGWLPRKLAGYGWILRHLGAVHRRRVEVQAASSLAPKDFALLLTSRLSPTVLGPLPGLPLLNLVLSAYWSLACRALRARPASTAR